MSLLNAVLRAIFDTVLWPFHALPALVGLVVLSIPVSIAMLLVFKKTSNQDKLATVKSRIHASLFEIRLFNDSLPAIFRAQGEILRTNLAYLGLSLVPLLWMIVPFVLMIGQLQYYYGYRGFSPGDETVVTVDLREDWRELGVPVSESGRPQLDLRLPSELELASPGVWLPSLDQLLWRVKVVATDEADLELAVTAGEQAWTKSVRISEELGRRAPTRVEATFGSQLLHPAEAPLPADSPLRAISVAYPEAGPMFFDLSVWVWLFFGITIVVAFALRKPFGVTI